MDISGKTALVTGGAKGIGLVTVSRLREAGAKVAVIDIDQNALDALSRDYPDVQALACDITDTAQIAAAIQTITERNGGIDVLVNNAGYIHSSPLLGFSAAGITCYDPAQWDKTIKTNLSSVFYVSSAVIRTMVENRRSGVIINISSICAAGNAGQSAYSATKAGVNALTVTWAKELGLMGVRVAGIAPGFVETETTVKAISGATLEDWKKKTPLRRLGKPAEIADAVMFIIGNDYFNGRILEVDGGLRI